MPDDFDGWSMPNDYWAMLYQQHAAQEADALTIEKFGTLRCHSCGRFMKMDNTHLNIAQLGGVHMKADCIEKAVKKYENLIHHGIGALRNENWRYRVQFEGLVLNKYKRKVVQWGPIGYFSFKRTYARPTVGTKTEEWWQTVRRVVEGTFLVQKQHCSWWKLPWSERMAQRSAQTMYDLCSLSSFSVRPWSILYGYALHVREGERLSQ